MDSDETPRFGRRSVLRGVLMLALFGLVVFAVDQFVPGARHRLAQAAPGWLIGALALELIACAAYAALFQAVFSRAPAFVRRRRSAEIALGELGAFAVTPTGLGGPVLRIWGLRSGGMPWRTLVIRSISHGAVFNLPYVAAATILGLGAWLRFLPGHAPVLTALAPLGVVLVVCAVAAGAVALARSERLKDNTRGHRAVQTALTTVPDGLRDLWALRRRPLAPLGSLGWWAGDCAALWAAFQAVGGRPDLSVLILAYMLGQLGNTLPLPGGVGGVEPLMLGIFSASGVNLGLAGAAVICYRAISLGVQGTLGTVAFVSLLGNIRRERGQTHTTGGSAPVITPPG